jgi:fatty-acyl-CoA synthase
MSRPDADLVLAAIAEWRVTHLCAAPVVLNAIVNHPVAQSTRFTHSVRIATGGAPPSPTTIERTESLGIELVHLYGLTETYGPSIICEPQEGWVLLPKSERAGMMARQGVRTVTVEQVRVVDGDMSDVPPDGISVGEILVRSNTMMAGYFRDDEATEAALVDGFLRTGDLGVIHLDGYIEIKDRAKDVIISGGENISSIEVEHALVRHPAVLEAAVVAVDDEKWGEVPVAFVVLRDGASVGEQELIDFVKGQIARFKAPQRIVFSELPKTSTGKIQKAVLRERLRTGVWTLIGDRD